MFYGQQVLAAQQKKQNVLNHGCPHFVNRGFVCLCWFYSPIQPDNGLIINKQMTMQTPSDSMARVTSVIITYDIHILHGAHVYSHTH